MDISIIIVNYNTAAYLEKCLSSIVLHTSGINYEIIVVDNNSPEREIESLPAKYPTVKFYFRSSNDGFGAGCNFGAENAKEKYLLFINPDVLLRDNVISKIFNNMENDPGIGVISPIYVDENDNVEYTYNYFPGIKWEWYEAFGIGASARIEKLLNRGEVKKGIPFEVDWVMGSFIFTRAELFRNIGGFDENIFLYYEDIDLQFKIRKLGYKNICRADLKILHYKRSSIRSYFGENLFYYHMTRSNLIYMYKHFSFFKRNLSKLFHVTGIIFRIISIPFRIKFRGKKTQKFEQYIFMLKFYLIGREKIFASSLMESNKDYQYENKNSNNDEFWKT